MRLRDTRGERLAGETGRAEREIEADGADRHGDKRACCDNAPPALRPGHGRDLAFGGGVSRGDQAARDLDARRLGFAWTDEAKTLIALDLFELILVDRNVVRGPAIARPP